MTDFSKAAGNAARPIILWYFTNPYAIGASVAIAYGLRNPSTRGWTIRMCQAYGVNMAKFTYRMVKDSVLITWSETVGAQGVKRRAAARASTKAVSRRVAAKSGTRIASRAALRFVPYVGAAIIIYDVGDYLVGDDPSFIGDIIDLLT